MARIVLAESARPATPVASPHRAATSEGEAAARLLESRGYISRKKSTQYESYCPFHEEPGNAHNKKKINFYVDVESSQYVCHSASCGEKGNLQTLERHFGIDTDDPTFVGREEKLRHYEVNLIPELRAPFYADGLSDVTIERFRLGYDPAEKHYVIPYLEGRRPRAFRFYNPHATGRQLKYWWEEGVSAQLYNASDAFGDAEGRVFIAEGEKKAMLLCQLGYAAVGVPGANTFRSEWHSAFSNVKSIIVCFDNDNPAFHVHEKCKKCGDGQCRGHNPGQEAAIKVVEALGWRARNALLPLPEGERKVDINEYIERDGNYPADFAELALGIRKTPYKMMSLSELTASPPEESAFVVEHGILPRGGRLLISGAPKVGKSICVQNLALSIASGIPFLKQFAVDEPRRVGLLDRELAKRSLFDRLHILMEDRPGYKAAMDNLMIDHEVQIKIDRPEALAVLIQLVEQNGLDVLILDTAYKFFASSFTNEDSVSKGLETLDRLIAETGVSVVLTHHHRKRGQDKTGKRREGPGDPDDVVGSFLWTGWPNATMLLNFLERRVESPFNTVASFVAFRDAAPPEPLALYRDRESIAYRAIQEYVFDEAAPDGRSFVGMKPSTDLVAELLISLVPIVEEDFLHMASGKFGCRLDTVKPYFLDLMTRGDFVRTSGRPPVLKLASEVEEMTYEEEQALAPVRQLHLVTEGGQQ